MNDPVIPNIFKRFHMQAYAAIDLEKFDQNCTRLMTLQSEHIVRIHAKLLDAIFDVAIFFLFSQWNF